MREIPAIKVHQWLPEWDQVKFDNEGTRRRPPAHFYVFSLPANELRALSGIQRRVAEAGDTGIQRRRNPRRTSEIQDYLRHGFPHADFSAEERAKVEYADSKMPGWLPTAIVVNILSPDFADHRRGRRVADGDHVLVRDGEGQTAKVLLPEGFDDKPWQPKVLPPLEVIDGQHRLWAFDDPENFSGYEVPVVAFCGLDVTWQAYLFYTINIRPVKINASLAYDLYPLLRTQNWLERHQGPRVYRETRAQEIVRSLYVHPESPWCNHINMLGEPGLAMVRQAAWIRSLLNTYVRPVSGGRMLIGGLFGAAGEGLDLNVDWHGAQQVAYIIRLGTMLRDHIRKMDQEWSTKIREHFPSDGQDDQDPAFYGRHSLLNTDQGIRGFLSITNDISVVNMDRFKLREWNTDEFGGPEDDDAIDAGLRSLRSHSTSSLLDEFITELATFDWRTSTAQGLTETQRTIKLAFRGSGGYRELRRRLLLHLASRDSCVADSASTAIELLGFERD